MYGSGAYGTTTYGSSPSASEEDPPPEGVVDIILPLRVTVAEASDIELPISVVILESFGITLPLRISIVEEVDIELPLTVTMSGAISEPLVRWTVVVVLNGEDISARLTEEVNVQAGEGEARIANFSIMPAAGTITLPDWTGKQVTIDVAEQDSSGNPVNPVRIFTGVVDEPECDLVTGIIRFECVDQMQQVFRNLTSEWIVDNIQGLYAESVFGEITDSLQHADARISTVPANFELSPFQVPRVVNWNLIEDPILISDDDIWDESLSLRMATRSDIVNELSVGFKYRFPRLRGRSAAVELARTIDFYTLQGLDIPNRAMIEQAVNGVSSWILLGEINYSEVSPGVYETVGSGGSVFTVVSATDAPNLAVGFAARFGTRWVQWVTEDYTFVVKNQASIDSVGRISDVRSGATMDVEFEDGEWQSSIDVKPLLTFPILGGDVSLDYGAETRTNRASALNAIETQAAIATRELLEAHRKTTLSLSIPCRPTLDLIHKLEVDCPRIHAVGKVSRISHKLSIETGEADTDIEISISGFSAVGLQPEDDNEAPSAPADPIAEPEAERLLFECNTYIGQVTSAVPYDPETMFGFFTNARIGPDYDPLAEAYPYELSIRSPEIEAPIRDPLIVSSEKEYRVAIPQDLLEVINP